MKRLAIVLSLALASGCVSKSAYLELESQYEGCKTECAELEARVARYQATAQAAADRLNEIRREFQPLIDRGVLEVTVDEGRIVIGMAADVLFPPGSAELSTEGRSNVIQVAKLLAKRSDREFQVEGHTDSDPISSDEFPSNWHLGSARAINVVQVMVGAGMSADQISAATFADTRPVEVNSTAKGKAKNRRIEVVLLPDLSELPGYKALMEHGRPSRKAKKKKGKRPPPRNR